ncbi:MAG TPA: GNAT family N-acetyltransferase [Terracidiphilus sp.]|nr:GNAT family N-acetyltransferase [Terracidiphilus sp.]
MHLVGMDMRRDGKNTMSRFEIEEGGETAYLEFELDGAGWMTLWHTEVPEALRGRGLAGELAKAAFDYARENGLRVDVICPVALHYLGQHPELKGLVGKGK